ncbi:MAG: type 4a pilus biogenesis protein PilO [Planctomycetia bacterium]|nr:type 4a pilus biogenesis protein PilO [Planctomycetia bacterium]
MTLHGRSGVVLGGAIVAAAALAALSVHLRVARIGPSRDRLGVLEEALEREQVTIARRPSIEAEGARLQARESEFAALLPADGADLEALRRSITGAASAAGVLVTAVRPAPAAHSPGAVEEIPVLIEARGDFASLGRFLDAVETLPRALTVDQFELKPGGAEAEARPETAGAELALRLTVWRVAGEGR